MPEQKNPDRWHERITAEGVVSRAREIFDIELEGIRTVRDDLGAPFAEFVFRALDRLDAGGKVVFTGIGKSGHIGRKIAATLASTGSRSVFMHPVEAMHGDLGILAEDDLLVALSYSGETEELLSVLPAAKRMGVPIVAVTGVADSRLSTWADLVVPMAVPREACPFNLAPTTTTTSLLVLGDALALVLLECRQFGLNDYAKLHPAGAIGRSITLRIADIMRTGDRFARVPPTAPVREALVAMTRARCGAVAVVGEDDVLLGIFTDGDFRRHIMDDSDLMDKTVRSVMTPDPISIPADAMAVELVKLLETRKIDDVLVVDRARRAVGLVDIQDLPRFKVM